jgi:hypothetical protein
VPVEIETSSVSYVGNGAQTSFPTTFSFGSDSDLRVTVDDVAKVLNVDYTVTGSGAAEPGGSVEFLAAPAAAADILIERDTAITQLTNFITSGPFTAASITRGFDKLTRVAQELARRVEALEAAGALYLSSPDFLAAIRFVEHDFATAAGSVEATFPFNVACSLGSTMTSAWITFLQNLDDPTEVFDEPPALQWGPAAGNFITIKRIAGLKPGTNYRFRLLAVA